MPKMLIEKVVIVTGAGRGIGRDIALLAAAQNAQVVVNDLGGSERGDGSNSAPADEVVEEIKQAGGQAVANFDNVAEPCGRTADRRSGYGQLRPARRRGQQHRNPARRHLPQDDRRRLGLGDGGAPQGKLQCEPRGGASLP